jgi:nucleoside-diphosphate-sugar epimerase
METIAVAGGTGKLGLTIAETLQENPEYSVIVLSRKVCLSILTNPTLRYA